MSFNPSYRLLLSHAHYALVGFLDSWLQDVSFEYSPEQLSKQVEMAIGMDQSINALSLSQLYGQPRLLFFAPPFYQRYYQLQPFDRKQKIVVYYDDGLTQDGGYDEENDWGVTYHLVGYSVAEVKAWVCCFLLARVSEFPQNEMLVLQIVKTYFKPSECLSLLEDKLTGRLAWDFGLEGKYAAEQANWQQAQNREQNVVCLQWLAMAQASWATERTGSGL